MDHGLRNTDLDTFENLTNVFGAPSCAASTKCDEVAPSKTESDGSPLQQDAMEDSESPIGSCAAFASPSLAESQIPVFQCLSTQLGEAQDIIQKLEAQVLNQDRLLKQRAEMACKRQHMLEAKVRELESKRNSANAIGEAARALETATDKMQTELAEAQQLRLNLNRAENRMRDLRAENEQMKTCIERMKAKMLEAEQCGSQAAQSWKQKCETLKADVCCLRSAAEDLCGQLHQANKKCATLQGVQTRLRDTCNDISSTSLSTDAVTERSDVKGGCALAGTRPSRTSADIFVASLNPTLALYHH
ncbi:unnamed protein product [Notodromas monacha]|uniref:Uncharacterized protein n=1 Tax=Notodromas monacha TaxID=399045 RepID=A0A7R9BZN3_9CRUS|nr:unnamed protein product [Notodromas monacha]CAG0923630.1 unnamed protein product [Notodromas monacha]